MKTLIGKHAWVNFDGKRRQSPSGFHEVEVKKVDTKKNGELRTMTVRMFSSLTGRFNGRKVKIHPNEWAGAACGVVWFGRIRPIAELAGA